MWLKFMYLPRLINLRGGLSFASFTKLTGDLDNSRGSVAEM